MTRPVAFFYECYTGPVAGRAHYCPSGYTGAEWSQEVLAIGTPAIWWGSMAALVFCLGWWLLHRDWRAGAVLCGVPRGLGAVVPAGVPDQVLLLRAGVRALPDLVHRAVPGADPRARHGQRPAPVDRGPIVGAYVLCVLLMFWYFYAILAGQVIPYHDWYSHMWYRIGRGWI